MGRIKVFLVLAITRRSAELKAVFFKIRGLIYRLSYVKIADSLLFKQRAVV